MPWGDGAKHGNDGPGEYAPDSSHWASSWVAVIADEGAICVNPFVLLVAPYNGDGFNSCWRQEKDLMERKFGATMGVEAKIFELKSRRVTLFVKLEFTLRSKT